jgi:predicted RNA-binding protein with PUA-like domain
MKVGDQCFFYHSSCKVPAIVGICRIARAAQPDRTAVMDVHHPHYDSKSTMENNRWVSVLVEFESMFSTEITIKELREQATINPIIANMTLLKQSRLSVMPITNDEWAAVLDLQKRKERGEDLLNTTAFAAAAAVAVAVDPVNVDHEHAEDEQGSSKKEKQISKTRRKKRKRSGIQTMDNPEQQNPSNKATRLSGVDIPKQMQELLVEYNSLSEKESDLSSVLERLVQEEASLVAALESDVLKERTASASSVQQPSTAAEQLRQLQEQRRQARKRIEDALLGEDSSSSSSDN